MAIRPVAGKIQGRFTVSRMDGVYTVHLNDSGISDVYLLNSMGQVVGVRNVSGVKAGTEVRFENLPKGNFIVRVK